MRKLLISFLLLAGCAQLPPSAGDVPAGQFTSAPGKAVIFVVRSPMDSLEPGTVTLNGRALVTTYRGHYYRADVDPGSYTVASLGFGTASVTLSIQPGKTYFVEHTVLGDRDDGGVTIVDLREVSEATGRRLVMQSRRLM